LVIWNNCSWKSVSFSRDSLHHNFIYT